MAFKFLVVLSLLALSHSLVLNNQAYDDLVVKVADTVPERDCANVIENLQLTLTSASQYLFSALDSRAYLRHVTVLLPPSWPDSCVPSAIASGIGETPDITVLPSDPARGKLWTQQSLGCGQPGDQIYLGYETLLKRDLTLGRSLIKEFAMYRYGVFEEQGYFNDPIYPLCYYDDQKKQGKVTGCSDLPINNGICIGETKSYNTTLMVDENARTSIMFAPEAPSVSMFCDEFNHDKLAPTKHNLICQRKSVLEVIMNHPDFANNHHQNMADSTQITDTTPKIVYKKQKLTRYVFVIENTKDMMQRESYSYLRLALRQWARNVVPDNTELGLVLSDSQQPTRALHIVPTTDNNRDKFYSSLPYTPSDSMQPGCLHCAIKEATTMLNERNLKGHASNVIIVIAPGLTEDEHLTNVLKEAKKSKIRIATINYPDIVRPNTLRVLAEATNGVDYTVFEKKLNVDTSLLSTYFELHNVLYNIVQQFYSGNEADLPMEIHRREITDDGRNSVTGSFMLDPNMGEPAQFNFFTHNTVTPLIKSLKLISPSHQVYTSRNDKFIDFKMITLYSNISETGTWTYTVEAYQGNPQPHYLQIMATPKSSQVPVIRAKFRTHRDDKSSPLILLAEVKYGEIPIMGAKVEVVATKHETNGTHLQKSKFELLDTGAGDPDITKGDGIYTRYFSAAELGVGLYTFEVVVSDNGNTAYTWTDTTIKSSGEETPCCGSSIKIKNKQPIAPFQRVLPKTTLLISSDEILEASQKPVGRIGDLKAEASDDGLRPKLSWTSPDLGGHTVARYEVKYAKSIAEIMDNFENSPIWENVAPMPLSPGSETPLTLDFSQNPELWDTPYYFAIKAYATMSSITASPTSNWVRVLVKSPPPPSTVPPTYSSNEQTYWPNNVNGIGSEETISPSVAKTMNVGLELILPVVIGIILLVVLLIVYCYFCVVKRRDRHDAKKSGKNAIKNDKLTSNITIVPSSPQHVQHNLQPTYSPSEMPDPHQIGVPVNNYAYEDETKKRYSLVHQQEQQLIEELKQQQQLVHRDLTPNPYGGLSVISNGSINRTQGGHTLSPYNSWTASQLLHEHERRHSPLENIMQDEQMMAHQDLMMNGSQIDQMSLNGQNEHNLTYPQPHLPPPVPPLPNNAPNGYPVNYNIYGVHPAHQQNHAIYQSMQRTTEPLVPFNPSLQGSMSSVNSGDKKRRNVTMV